MLAAGRSGDAQRSSRAPLFPVRGVVFDSVRGQPLENARVTIDAGRSTHTDDRGRFRFDSVGAGVRTISVQHALLDSLGLFGILRRADIRSAEGEIRIGIPSFATLWHNGCGSAKPPVDSGIVYGLVRDVRTGRPIAGAKLQLVWSELALGEVKVGRAAETRVVERRWTSDTRSAADGTYAFCRVPATVARVRASTDSGATGFIELEPSTLRVRRQDLAIGLSGAPPGLVVGYLNADNAEPFIVARITLDDSLEARSEFDGRFVFANVATGSHQLVARYIGATPVRRTVDVVSRDTTLVAMTMSKVVTLATMHVASPERARMLREAYEARQITYHRFLLDSTYVGRQHAMVNVFQSLPNVTVKRAGLSDFTLLVPDRHNGSCVPNLRVDGVAINDFGQLAAIAPSRVVAVEVYPYAMQIPAEFQRGGIRDECGLVVVWTKWAFRIP
jgi:hypothetical protein